MYMYPDNLKGKATLWLWYLRDIGIVGVGAIIGVIAISHANFYMPIQKTGKRNGGYDEKKEENREERYREKENKEK